MSKAAKNEKLKLKAAYFNNVASALTVVGYVLPVMSLNGGMTSRLYEMIGWQGITITNPEDKQFVGLVTSAFAALIAAFIFRFIADKILTGIED